MSVNIHTEWGPLKEVIVGNIGKWTTIHPDFSFLLFFHENIKDALIQNSVDLTWVYISSLKHRNR